MSKLRVCCRELFGAWLVSALFCLYFAMVGIVVCLLIAACTRVTVLDLYVPLQVFAWLPLAAPTLVVACELPFWWVLSPPAGSSFYGGKGD